MNQLLLLLIIFFGASIVHEIGHMIADWVYTGKKPKLKIKWWGLAVDIDTSVYTIKAYVYNLLVGVFSGAVVILIAYAFLGVQVWIAYLIACGIDLSMLWQMNNLVSEGISTDTILDNINCILCEMTKNGNK